MERIKEVERLLRQQKKPEPEREALEACKTQMAEDV